MLALCLNMTIPLFLWDKKRKAEESWASHCSCKSDGGSLLPSSGQIKRRNDKSFTEVNMTAFTKLMPDLGYRAEAAKILGDQILQSFLFLCKQTTGVFAAQMCHNVLCSASVPITTLLPQSLAMLASNNRNKHPEQMEDTKLGDHFM